MMATGLEKADFAKILNRAGHFDGAVSDYWQLLLLAGSVKVPRVGTFLREYGPDGVTAALISAGPRQAR